MGEATACDLGSNADDLAAGSDETGVTGDVPTNDGEVDAGEEVFFPKGFNELDELNDGEVLAPNEDDPQCPSPPMGDVGTAPCPKPKASRVRPKAKTNTLKASRPKAKTKVSPKARAKVKPSPKAKATATSLCKAKAKAHPEASAGSKGKPRPKESRKGERKNEKKSKLREDPVWKKMHSVPRHMFSSPGFQKLIACLIYVGYFS